MRDNFNNFHIYGAGGGLERLRRDDLGAYVARISSIILLTSHEQQLNARPRKRTYPNQKPGFYLEKIRLNNKKKHKIYPHMYSYLHLPTFIVIF